MSNEPADVSPPPFTIGPWTVHAMHDRVERDGESHKLEPRLMRLLLTLARAGGAVVPTGSLLATVWAGVVVTPSSLYESISRLRKLLGRDEHGHDALESVPRKGYRLRWPVEMEGSPGLGEQSVAVLPFEAVDLENSLQFISKSLVDGLIGELSRQPELAVVARGTMIEFAHRRESPVSLGRHLGVRSVIDGRIRRIGPDLLSIQAELIDVPSGRQTWAETIEVPAAHWLQSAAWVIGRLTRALTFEAQAGVLSRGTESDAEALPARSLATQAWVELFARPETAETNMHARRWAAEAALRDPQCGLAEICLATCDWRAGQFGWDGLTEEEARGRAHDHAERAVVLAPTEPDAHYVLALIAYGRGETVRAEEALRQCLRLSASFAPAYGLLALVRTRLGHPDEAPALCDRALLLSPREPLRAVWYLALAWSALARKQYAAALDAAQRGMAANPGLPTNYAAGAAAAQALGEKDLAARWVHLLRERSVFRSVPAFLRRMPVATSPAHRRQMQQAARLLAQAGLPEVE
ncbi:winged helix-turn-helix domain-containing protein [Variovorax sp. LT2P21]|uniref:winged helix-turn-helix domain-containing protein n=1 Tax=Variovorax sp. LT2P21 TaxID=3443731 RepID=UPI003F477F36